MILTCTTEDDIEQARRFGKGSQPFKRPAVLNPVRHASILRLMAQRAKTAAIAQTLIDPLSNAALDEALKLFRQIKNDDKHTDSHKLLAEFAIRRILERTSAT